MGEKLKIFAIDYRPLSIGLSSQWKTLKRRQLFQILAKIRILWEKRQEKAINLINKPFGDPNMLQFEKLKFNSAMCTVPGLQFISTITFWLMACL